jgi:hypothetical protein
MSVASVAKPVTKADADFDADVALVYRELVERFGLTWLTDKSIARKIAVVLADDDATGSDMRLVVDLMSLLPVPNGTGL